MPSVNELLSQLSDISIHSTDNRNYWMVRTQDGIRYKPFYEKKIVGMMIPYIPLSIIPQINRECNNEKERQDYVKRYLDNHKDDISIPDPYRSFLSTSANRSTRASQFVNFSFVMKTNDIVVIPSRSSDEISIGKISGPDLIVDQAITREFPLARPVDWLKTISKGRLDPNLYRALGAHQALANISKYAGIIERSYNSCFAVGENYHYIISINSDEASAKDLFGLGYNIIEMIEDVSRHFGLDIDSNEIKLAINLNSPGKIDLKSKFRTILIAMGIVAALSGGTIKYQGLEIASNGLFDSLVTEIIRYKEANQNMQIKQALFDRYMNSLQVTAVEDTVDRIDEEINP